MKLKKIISLILIFSIFQTFSPLFSEDTSALPYEKDEFPVVLQDIRRFEILTLGAMPFVTIDTMLVYSGIRVAKNGGNFSYFVNPLSSNTNTALTEDEQKGIILTSLGISAGIALTDLIVRLIKRGSEKKQNSVEENIPVKIHEYPKLKEYPDEKNSEKQETSENSEDKDSEVEILDEKPEIIENAFVEEN